MFYSNHSRTVSKNEWQLAVERGLDAPSMYSRRSEINNNNTFFYNLNYSGETTYETVKARVFKTYGNMK